MDADEVSFGRFRLDLKGRRVWRDSHPVRLGGRTLDLLYVLASAKGEVVNKDEIIAQLWPGRAVEDGNLHVQVSALRRALAEHGDGPSYVMTVPGRGYRLVDFSDLPNEAADKHLPLPDKPSIAVLPFANLSNDPEQEYFADGMVEEIITALSRIRWLFVIACNSTFAYKDRPIDVKRVGRELGVRYVLEGSVRKAGSRMRITAQLIEAETGAHLWADHFDGRLEDVFELQDQAANNVAGVIEPTLQVAETRRSAHCPTTDLHAYDLYLRALSSLFRLSRAELSTAANLLEQAVAADPNFGPALAFASVCHMRRVVDGWSEHLEEDREKAISYAQHAIEVASADSAVLANAAYTLEAFGENLLSMMGLVDRALTLNPSYARGWYISAWMQLVAGRSQVALEHIEKSLRLSPREYIGTPALVTSWVYFVEKSFDLAAQHFRMAMLQVPGSPWPYLGLAACLAHQGKLTDARAAMGQLDAMGAIEGPVKMQTANARLNELFLSGINLITSSSPK